MVVLLCCVTRCGPAGGCVGGVSGSVPGYTDKAVQGKLELLQEVGVTPLPAPPPSVGLHHPEDPVPANTDGYQGSDKVVPWTGDPHGESPTARDPPHFCRNEEFHPMLFQQHRDKPHREFPSVNQVACPEPIGAIKTCQLAILSLTPVPAFSNSAPRL